ncbi:enniatin synthase [Fusarium pseudoanthophilum]|uniref:Enniatin synthase n=1 Tax=Fusarium pseudoanthophilum TaxID=48495 RepID=A0A8H5NFU4_9HYPO|nr:enniatin synthase [Fusarium pseudoanthophilum]
MILFNFGDGLQSYRGLEPSKSAAAFTNSVIKSVPSLASKAEVHIGTAQDIGQMSDLHPDLVVSAARQWSQSGALDAVFHRPPLSSDTRRTLIKFPTENHLRGSATLANRPLQGLQRRHAILLGVITSIGGFLFGYDTGQISSMLLFKDFIFRFAI